MQYNYAEILLIYSLNKSEGDLNQIGENFYSNRIPVQFRGLEILFTGYLFNFKELNTKEFDNVEELIADFYLKKHLNELTRVFEGYYSAVIIDKERVTIIMDKYGIETGYYIDNQDSRPFIFSTSLKLLNEKIGLSLNAKSIASYLLITEIPSDETLYDDVNKLERGERLNYENERLEKTPYDYIENLTAGKNNKIEDSTDIILHEVDDLLEEIIHERVSQLPHTNRYNLLSGGVDSSLIQAYLAKNSGSNRSLCVNLQNFGIEDQYSMDVADSLKSEHYVHQQSLNDVLSGMDTGIHDLLVPWIHIGEGMINQLLNHKLSNVSNIGLFSGNGSDTLFGHGKAMKIANFNNNHPIISRMIFPALSVIDKKWEFAKLISQTDNRISYELAYELFVNKNAATFLEKSLVQEIINEKCSAINSYPGRFIDKLYFTKIFDGEITWENSTIYKLAKVQNFCVVFPFTDERLVKYVMRIPFKKKLQKFQSKFFSKKILKRYLPKNYVYREKVGKRTPWLQLFNTTDRQRILSFYRSEFQGLIPEDFFETKFGYKGFEAESIKLRNVYQISKNLTKRY